MSSSASVARRRSEFQHTLDLLEEIRFDVVHVAAYSPRPGTLAYKWEDDVPLEEKKRRLHAVEQVQERIAREMNADVCRADEEVLIEARQVAGGEPQWRGRTRTNKLVFFPATRPSQRVGAGGAPIGIHPGDLVDGAHRARDGVVIAGSGHFALE